MDAVSQMDLVFIRAALRLALGLARQSVANANVNVQSGLYTRGDVSERDEPKPVGRRHEHLHARV